MTTNFYPETRASVIELRDEFTFANQKSTKMRHMIQYLATHDINCDSWMLGSISYTWPVEDLESRLRRYVEHRLQVFEGTAPDLSFKGTRIWECDDRIEADIRHEIFQWDSMQESEGLAATTSRILANYYMSENLRFYLRKALLSDTCEQAARALDEFVKALDEERCKRAQMNRPTEGLMTFPETAGILKDLKDNVRAANNTFEALLSIRKHILLRGLNKHSRLLLNLGSGNDYETVRDNVHRYCEARIEDDFADSVLERKPITKDVIEFLKEKAQTMDILKLRDLIAETISNFRSKSDKYLFWAMTDPTNLVVSTLKFYCGITLLELEEDERRFTMNDVEQLKALVEPENQPIMIEGDKHFHRCDDCGELFHEDDMEELRPGLWVCDRHRDNYYTCDDCGEIYHQDDMTWIESCEREVCSDCLDNYRRCSDCGEYFHEDDIYYVDCAGDYYCESCRDEHFTTCADCGEYIYQDDAYWNDDDGPYCSECYENHSIILDYHDDVDFDPLRMPDEDSSAKLYGIELEVSGDRDYAGRFQDIMGYTVVLMNDSSIENGGFEIVTMPMTRRYIKEKFLPRLTEGLEFLKSHNFKGHDHGGMHVHIDIVDDPNTLIRMTKVLYGDMDSKAMWLELTQRNDSSLSQWGAMDNRRASLQELLDGRCSVAGTRYTALNYDDERSNSHELRIFNSTTRLDRFMKNMEVVWALEDFSKRRGRLGVDIWDYLEFVRDNFDEYRYLNDFLVEKDLVGRIDLMTKGIPDLFEDETQSMIDLYEDHIDFDNIPDITEDDMVEIHDAIERAMMEDEPHIEWMGMYRRAEEERIAVPA